MKNQSFFPILEVLIVITTLLILAVALFGFPGGILSNYSEGSRTGVVTKLSKKGVFWKSWEGEMNMGGVLKSGPNVFTFNVHNGAVPKVEEVLRCGKPVTLVYRQWLIRPMSISNTHVVVDVKDE